MFLCIGYGFGCVCVLGIWWDVGWALCVCVCVLCEGVGFALASRNKLLLKPACDLSPGARPASMSRKAVAYRGGRPEGSEAGL